MATYSGIKGFTIQSLATDPYLSTVAAGTWTSGGALPATRYVGGSAGTQTSNLFAGGASAPPANSNQTDTSFEYDGTSWTAGGSLITARFAIGGFGATNTAAIMAGGEKSPGSTATDNVESYNGTSFTATTAINTARGGLGSVGTQTAGLVFAGDSVNTEIWNGSTWTEVANVSAGNINVFSAGTSTAALEGGGQGPGGTAVVATVESWDGSSWTAITDFNTAREKGGGSGTNTDAIFYGGTTANGAKTEYYDGTTWTEVADLATARISGGGAPAGTSSLALYAGGLPSGATTATEEFTVPAAAISIAQEGQVWYNTTSTVLKGYKLTFNAGAWASGVTANNTRASFAGFGTQTAALQAIGTQNPGSTITKTETFDGTTWTEVNDNITVGDSVSGCGIVTAGIMNSRSPSSLLTESWDGTCWSEVNDQNDSSRGKRADAGTQAAAVCAGGENHPAVMNDTETWDGTCWTPVAGVLNNGRSVNYGGAGTSTAAIISGGAPPGNFPVYGYTEVWDGTSWEEKSDMNNPVVYGGAAGTSTDSWYAGGLGHPGGTGRTNAETWDGTSWTTAAVLGTAVQAVASAGNSTAGLIMSGYLVPWSTTAITQEWNVPSGNEIKTFTAS